jgi:hypothetical protein
LQYIKLSFAHLLIESCKVRHDWQTGHEDFYYVETPSAQPVRAYMEYFQLSADIGVKNVKQISL